jgi:hypothetical protein
MSYDTLFTAMLIIFGLLGIWAIADAIICSYRTRWTWRYRDVIKEAPKPDNRDSIQTFKRMMDTKEV